MMLNKWSTRDADLVPDVDAFRPERYLDANAAKDRNLNHRLQVCGQTRRLESNGTLTTSSLGSVGMARSESHTSVHSIEVQRVQKFKSPPRCCLSSCPLYVSDFTGSSRQLS